MRRHKPTNPIAACNSNTVRVRWPKTDLAANVTRIPDVGAGAFALWWLSAAVYLALTYAVPLIAMLAAMSLTRTARPAAAQLRAKRAALLAFAAPTMFTFDGVVLSK